MTANSPHNNPLASAWLRSSYRTKPEQILGSFIFLIASSSFDLFNRSLYPTTSQLFFARPSIWTLYYILISFAMWNLWRHRSLKIMKLEMFLFVVEFLLQTSWVLSFFVLQETFLALFTLLLLCSNTLLLALLYWKRERLSGQILIAPLFWVTYVMWANMMICIASP